jgi:hypothetical protein
MQPRRKRKGRKEVWKGAVATEIARGEKSEELWKIYRVIDEQRRRRVTFILDF